MADLAKWRKNIPEGYDGRFGEKFDDEILSGEILKISAGILALVLVSVAICLVFYRMILSYERPEAKPASPIAAANERLIPPGPLLQSHPEAEMAVLRAEQVAHLGSFGWVDEAHGVVRMPIDQAIDLVAAGHLPAPIVSTLEAPVAAAVEEGPE